MKRRHFVLGPLAAACALGLGWTLLPPRRRLVGSRPLPAVAGQRAFNGWLRIGSDDRITVVVARSEMGQGVHTGLAMVLADELDADWSRVQVEPAPVDAIYNNIATVVDALPFHPDDAGTLRRGLEWVTAKAAREFGLMMTGGSSSLKDLWLPMREAGASARAMLVAAAAARWGVAPAEIGVKAGVLSHASGKSARMGELAEAAARLPIPPRPRLKTPAEFSLIGRAVPRIEAASKTDGSARFGIDVREPGMVYASVQMCPTLGGRVARFDAAAASGRPGVLKLLALPPQQAGASGGVAVIAERPWQALAAARDVAVQWEHGAVATLSSAALMDSFATALDRDESFTYFSRGDVDAALAGAAHTLKAEYRAPYLAHLALEPINCTVLVKDGAATVWASTQVPDIARAVAARALGLDESKVEMRVQLIGGGFGRRLDTDFVAQAALIAQALPGRPVQLIWSREQDTTHDFYRPGAVARLAAGLDAQGRLVAWSHQSASQAIVPQAMARYAAGVAGLPQLAQGQLALGRATRGLGYLPGMGMDKTAAEGSFDQPYEFAAARVGHTLVEAALPVGFWRSVGHSHQAFFKESFLDEVAHAAGQDPVALRAGLLGKHPRHLRVLQRAAELAGWGKPLQPAADGAPVARGVALHQSFGSVVAEVVEASLAGDRSIRVHRVVAVIDCGTPVNPGLIRQQLESAVVFGLSAALFGETTIVAGRVQESNFHDQPVLRLAACPEIVTDIIASDAHPEGVGEPGVPPLAPALANALFALTGQRLRSLPLRLF
ncbi:Isoquinoline 1-oxidoreductase beta subunit [Rubrivivax sp. A210]|uniref:xanthine dehydrogenase family protein molybdopterin-binding subunit n=1 Tax=Rubrivivax sp. A210 TaxID=2772301 RepID=UPI00191B7151|nr:molybdopterin cofactor-binding domain-containing protein [Rubrivivax sp. A210]CAD5373275.1 Isoquinoline 1-oxidoreductase beta subunit [Rubrivivax sp. A210]